MTTNTKSAFGRNNIFAPESPSIWQHLQRNPLLIIAQWLYAHRPPIVIPRPTFGTPVKVVCISDTHNEKLHVPNGDILIHSGDMTINGTFEEIQLQLGWLNSLPHHHKIVIAGNHDLLLDQSFFHRNPRLASPDNERKMKELKWGNVVYLNSESRTFDVRDRTVRIYGSPMTPQYGNWAFQYPENEDKWCNTIPESTDILVTNGPAKGHLDSSASNPTWVGAWVLYALGRENRGVMTSVNAAVVGDWGLAEGKKTLIVDLV
ncbi:unnamed protein product [Alternaria alternata]